MSNLNKIASRVFSVTQDLGTSSVLTINGNNIGFVPDKCVIKQITYYLSDSDSKGSGMYQIQSNLTNDTVALVSTPTYYDGSANYYMIANVSPNIEILLKNGVNNNITFTTINLAGGTPEGVIGLTIEFSQNIYHNK